MALKKPDIIIWDRESRKKCSIYPLRQRSHLSFIHSDRLLSSNFAPEAVRDCLFLHVDGPPLTVDDCDRPLLLLDASWKRAERLTMIPALAQLPKRSLHQVITAYPRKSKLYSMPAIGLASVEALYIAYLIQGREDPSLLNYYHWRQQFLHANMEIISLWRQVWANRWRQSKGNL